jgi:hypothetical protein
MTKSLTNFTSLSDSGLESKTELIISSLTGNTSFPTPTPTLAALQTAADAFSAALLKAGTGNRVDIAIKNAAREVLVDLMRNLCMYVNLTANGDRAMLLSSGFNISKDREPIVITKPENLKIETGLSSGELLLSVNAVKGASAYLHEYSTDATLAPQSWVSTTTTASKALLDNLQPGVTYYCRVGVVGPNGQLLYSDAASRMAI